MVKLEEKVENLLLETPGIEELRKLSTTLDVNFKIFKDF